MINKHGIYVGIISHLRAENVPKMHEVIGGQATWYVGDGEGDAYREHGAEYVIESGGLCESRNAILRDAWALDVPALELSDDLKKFEEAYFEPTKGKCVSRPIGFDTAVVRMLKALLDTRAKLCGVAPTNNAFYFNPKRPVHTRAFIVGDMILVKPSDIFFDEGLKLKEDYDYTLQHLKKFGRIARCDGVLAHFAHRTNSGGACAFRTAEREQEAIAFLKNKWGGLIKDNAKRPNEILLNLPRRKKQ